METLYIRTMLNISILVKTPLIFPIPSAPAPFPKRGVWALNCYTSVTAQAGERQDEGVYNEGHEIYVRVEQTVLEREKWRKKGILWHANICKLVSYYLHGSKISGLFLNSWFWGWLSTESQPQNAELRRL